jgi:hypothetical protein
MTTHANVRSLDAVQNFRPALARFEEEAGSSLAALRMEVHRTIEWFEHDCPAYWQQIICKSFYQVAECRTQLARKQMMKVAGRTPDCTDEKLALQRAKRRLEMAQEKLEIVRQWAIKVRRASDEFMSRLSELDRTVTSEMPRMIAHLDRIVTALEGYVGMAGPLAEGELPAGSMAQSINEHEQSTSPVPAPAADGVPTQSAAPATPAAQDVR